jgi:O-succinylbenzoic acid--CoA ligase
LGGEVRFDFAATHSLVYTSGTTGKPKAAVLTYGNHLWSAVSSALNLGLREDDRWLACLPLFHVGGLAILLRSAIYGTAAIVHEGFDPARVNAAIDRDGVTIVSVVANMLQRMLDERGDRPYPASLRCVLLGGGPAPAPLLQRCSALGVPVVQTYGLTETASQVATLAPEDALRKLGSAGKPLFGTELRIEASDGAVLPPGNEGEVVVRGPTVTPGYLNNPDATARAIRDGWLHTGDVGYLDEEGYLYILDRRDDLIVSGGENVYPAEIEAVLQSHPDVLEGGVYGVLDERWGQSPVAAVVLRAGAEVTPETLLAYCRERLAAYKAPSSIEFRAELPRNAAGKLVRRRLLEHQD